jgi:uncharacterized protein (DUF58 family)
MAFLSDHICVALLYRQNDLSLLAILVLIVMGGTKAWSSMGPARIRCDSTIDTRRVFPGESVTLATMVENGKWLPIWLRIMWSFGGALKPVGDNGNIIRQEASVLWHQTVEFHQDFVALRRGVYQVGPPRIRTSDFLGFFEREKRATDTIDIIVYPRLVSLRPIAIKRRDLFGVPGAKSPVKDPAYILGTRDYQPSRPSRHIHWKASARHLRLQEKIFEPSEQEKVLLTLDVGSFGESNQKECFEHSLKQSLGSQRGVSCVHFCYEDDPSVSELEKIFQKRQIPATFLVCRRDPNLQPSRRNEGVYRYFIDEIRIDRSRRT